MKIISKYFLLVFVFTVTTTHLMSQERKRPRALGINPGILTPGKWNAITDVQGVKVGHTTLMKGDSVRTGVTAVFPHDGNLYQQKVPASIYVGNGYGKLMGISQVQELGNIETPIVLTNTLSVPVAADALTDYILGLPENENVRSVNAIVGETNDGWLNDIRGKHIKKSHVIDAIENATSGPVQEGNVGAGTGTRCLGYKGGIGTSSRVLPSDKGGYTVGVLVQANFGGILTINGAPVGEELQNHYMAQDVPYDVDGSVMIIVATNAPLSSRNLERLAKRSFMALARVGSFASNGSGDYSIAFSTHPELGIKNTTDPVHVKPLLKNDALTPLFLATVEATEEAVLNALFMAEDMKGFDDREQLALPVDKVLEIMDKYSLRDK